MVDDTTYDEQSGHVGRIQPKTLIQRIWLKEKGFFDMSKMYSHMKHFQENIYLSHVKAI